MNFKEVVISQNVDIFIRLVIGVTLVIFGLSTFGALFGVLAGSVFGFVMYKKYLTKLAIGEGKKNSYKPKNMLSKSIPIVVGSIATFSLISMDIILVKHFFPSHQAGIYASLSTLGKITYFATLPIGAVMFPYVSKRHSKGYGYRKIFMTGVFLNLAISSVLLCIYYFYPNAMINILFGEGYLQASVYLFKFGIFISLVSLATFMVNFFLSRGNKAISKIAAVAALI
ncbi:unnamed protein product, partial [marine sediment metagenome]